MGERTGIAWCDHTFNPWRGCTKVSAGCANCYAETVSKRNPAVLGEWGPGGKRAIAAESYWCLPDRWNRAAQRDGVRRRVFCASLADVFEDRPELDAPRRSLFAAIAATPNLDKLLLTKRPENITRLMPEAGLPNVWLGVSVEDQKTADERIPLLLQTPAAVRFVSYEPALGPVDFRAYMGVEWPHRPLNLHAAGLQHRLDWLIVGGESGPKARPFDVAWARTVRDQCHATGTAFFMKQVGANVRDRNDAGFEADLETFADGPNEGSPTEPRAWPSPRDVEHDPADTGYQGAPVRVRLRDRAGADPAEWPEDLRVREFPEVRRG